MRSFFTLLLLLFLGCGVVRAHIITEIPMKVEQKDGKISGHLDVDAAYMLSEYRGDDDQTAPDLAWLRSLSPEEKERLKMEAEGYLKQCLALFADDLAVDWQISFPDFDSSSPAYMTEGEPEEAPILRIDISADFPEQAKALSIDWREPFGVVLIVQSGQGQDTKTIPIPGGRAVVIQKNAEVPTFLHWIHLGFKHILPEGKDHILFVVGLFLLLPKWKPLLQQTVTFTLAHSLTLAAASLGWINLDPKWVEVAIAASIAWVGIENLWAKDLGKGRLYLVGIFGLIHGLGFASVLKDYLPSATPGALAPALLGFNLGVEGGQITVLVIAFAAFGWMGKHFVWVKRTGSIFVGLCGALLVIQRIFEVEIIPWL